MVQVGLLDEKKYGRLVAQYRPRLIQSDAEFDRLSAELERLDSKEDRQGLEPEEAELQALLAHLVTEYEDRTVANPDDAPLDTLKHIMEQKGLRAVDLLDVFGSRAVASQVLNGRREISKAHARKLAERFKLSVAAFIG
ncbi:MAG: hypothetical protein U0Q16_35975 [Bryobacteraceae bacterium]